MNATETLTEELSLAKYTEQAKRAYYWQSFDPDKRGNRTIIEFSQMLNNDLAELERIGATLEIVEQYKGRFERYFTEWLGAESRCASAMVTGSANFPVSRNEKARNSEINKYTAFMEWREKAKKAIKKQQEPVKTFSSELDRYKTELESLKNSHEKMKEGNKRIKAAQKTGEDLTEYLTTEFGIVPHMIEWTMRWGFGLSNNLANIKRVEERISTLEKKAKNAEETPEKSTSLSWGKIVQNNEMDRLQLFFNEKPNADNITLLKKNGFKWAPSVQAWQRQLTPNAIYSLKNFVLPNIK